MEVLESVIFELWIDFFNIVKRIVDCFYILLSVVNVGMILFGDSSKVVFNFNILFDEVFNNYEVKRFVYKVIL